MTFTALVKNADFKADPRPSKAVIDSGQDADEHDVGPEGYENSTLGGRGKRSTRGFGGLHYNIQIILPESRDPKVYDALFRSLNEHLL